MKLPDLKEYLTKHLNRTAIRVLILVACSLLSIGALIFPIAIRPSLYPLQVGDVSNQDIQAPKSLSFVSQILTDQAIEKARNAVSPIYLPANPAITRRQIEYLRVALNYISTVRFDSYASLEQKVEDLTALDQITLSRQTAEKIITLSDSRWQGIQQESLSVLEQVMRKTIRDDQLPDAQRSVPTLISFALSEDQANIVSDLVTPFVVPNSLLSEDLTEKARLEAEQKVTPEIRSFVSGEVIVRRGQVITNLTWEALEQFGLIQPENRQEDVISAIAIVLAVSAFLGIYFNRRRISPMHDLRSLFLVSLTFLIFLYGAKTIIPNRTIIPYIYPLPAFALTIAALYNLEVGLVFPLVLSILAAYGLPNSLDLTIFYVLTSLFGVLILGKGRRIMNFFWAGIAIGVIGSAVIIAYRLPDTITDWIGIATLIGAAFFNGVASASLTLILQFLFAQILGVTTALQLLELARPDNPLLQFFLRSSPGSYQHSLQVANLAEQAAEAIGADPLLTRVGAIYHDAGKALNPSFFIENQVGGKIDSHDDIPPEESAATIIRHVTEGVNLAKKYRLPSRIQDFMREHHGTLYTRYQYTKAVEAVGNDPSKVDITRFRYPGPSPRSKETAILMIADGVEARARAEIPGNEDELRNLIRKVIDYCQREGQLDNTTLTLRDLSTITDSFVQTLKNTYHPRIKYPELKTVRSDEQTDVARDTVPTPNPNQT